MKPETGFGVSLYDQGEEGGRYLVLLKPVQSLLLVVRAWGEVWEFRSVWVPMEPDRSYRLEAVVRSEAVFDRLWVELDGSPIGEFLFPRATRRGGRWTGRDGGQSGVRLGTDRRGDGPRLEPRTPRF
ncbi:MAG: hypothetical protein KatS3mg115_2104 [Candidatus Poribacteria bacterium]|nr:MAG: hypothetical protein KatS3mg115_2104 [Candidatus Poribacteria bacterium]